MSLRTFILGLSASFGIAWLAIVVVPYFKMRTTAPIHFDEGKDGTDALFFPKRAGRISNGAEIYAENGCYLCHTQVVRPTYAGNDFHRPDWGGLKNDPELGDTRRESNAFDYLGERFAQIGVTRFGPDLSNLGLRVEKLYTAEGEDPEQWLYAHLYDPRLKPEKRRSACPSFRFLFRERKIHGSPAQDALAIGRTETTEIVPTAEARALVSYLLSLKKDQAVPSAMKFEPPASDAPAAADPAPQEGADAEANP